jgi:hypothetical protein
MTARSSPTSHTGEKPPFLDGVKLRRVTLADRWPFTPTGLALGGGASGLEVLIATYPRTPSAQDLRAAWKVRHGGRAAPLLLVVLYEGKAALCGPAGDDPPARLDLDPHQVDRICREALGEADRHTALRALRDSLPALDTDLGGLRNEGFLATHELRAGARQRADWRDAAAKASRILDRKGTDLLKALGFQIESCDRVTSILRSRDRKVAVAVLLNRDESPELQAGRFADISPVSYALAVADRENLPYVVIQHGAKVRVYPARVGVGVGRRGRTETYVECHAGLLHEDNAALLWLLCSAEALLPGGSLDDLIAASGRFSGDLAAELRERIYLSVVPKIAQGLVAARQLKKPTAQDLHDTYEMALVVLFRLLFIAYAEDKDLLPYRWNGLYQRRSLKTKAQEILDLVRKGLDFDAGDNLWDEVHQLFRAVDVGNREWGVPPYDGGLFTEDPEVSRVGALLAPLRLPNTTLGPALRDLMLVTTEDGLGPVDFRSLGVREFGTIYEGLLESELAVAESDLAVDKEGIYRPCKKGEQPLVTKGEVYLHNASGARKSTGSYFTKQFAVEHLLERALEPALAEHLARLDTLSTEEAGDRFFDFRVADISMGSGHFLIAAIDHIEKALSGYLARTKLPTVLTELATLRAAAVSALGPLAEQVEIEDTQLLRRLIARRCIYGVDVNPTAVQLARLAVWVHTFVPRLPLSLLDHGLVTGNSLVGIGRLDEVKSAIEEESLPLFPIDATYLLGAASEPLKRLARLADATPSDLARARKASAEALEAVAPASALCDLVAASRITGDKRLPKLDGWDQIKAEILGSLEWAAAKRSLQHLQPFHFPIAFPEVFLRSRPGFDVIVGNPPWEEAMCDVNEYWGRYIPGFRGLPQRDQEALLPKFRQERPDLERAYKEERRRVEALRTALAAGPYPGMDVGHPDLYKAFCWRFWNLIADDGGRVGVVLPRSALAAKGSTSFREEVFELACDVGVTMLLNNKQWFFDNVHPQYTIGLVTLLKRHSARTSVALQGPYPSFERYGVGIVREPAVFYGDDIKGWNDTASLPLLPSEQSLSVFLQLRAASRLDLDNGSTWRARPIQGDLNATWGKPLMDFQSEACPPGYWPVFKGESLDIWTPDTGTYYAWIDPQKVIPELLATRQRASRNRRSPFSEFDRDWCSDSRSLPCQHARIAFRDVTRATDSRTVRVALVPPHVVLANQAPYLLWPRGGRRDEAFLLAVLSSIPLDWYARRFVETHLNFFVLNPLPIPRPSPGSQLHQRAIALAGRLACHDDRFVEWANDVGVEVGRLPDDVKLDMIHELDAVVAHLYGLDEKHLVHIFETFHEGWNFEPRLKETRKHFREWKRRIT